VRDLIVKHKLLDSQAIIENKFRAYWIRLAGRLFRG
jgi:hypothetical protein